MKLCEYLNSTAEIYTLHYIIALADRSNPIEILRKALAREPDPYQQFFYIASKHTDINIDIFRKVEIIETKKTRIIPETKKAVFHIFSTRYAELIIQNIPIPHLQLKTRFPNRVRIDLVAMLIYT
jgi:hypothetical protein